MESSLRELYKLLGAREAVTYLVQSYQGCISEALCLIPHLRSDLRAIEFRLRDPGNQGGISIDDPQSVIAQGRDQSGEEGGTRDDRIC